VDGGDDGDGDEDGDVGVDEDDDGGDDGDVGVDEGVDVDDGVGEDEDAGDDEDGDAGADDDADGGGDLGRRADGFGRFPPCCHRIRVKSRQDLDHFAAFDDDDFAVASPGVVEQHGGRLGG
jgi:hypothetical protein